MDIYFRVEYTCDLFPDNIVFSECWEFIMGEGVSIIDIGKLSEPAKVLIEKVSDGIGGIVKPYQIKRVAKAEAEAEIIETLGKIKATELQQRAIHRLIGEEAQHQANMESITEKAIGYLEDNALPEKMENDWISNFFDKCRLVSDEDMQNLWAKVLAGEANESGRYSKRTVNFVATLCKTEARLFSKLCSFIWHIGTEFVCIIKADENKILKKNGMDFDSLVHLDEIGLITFDNTKTFHKKGLPKNIKFFYFNTPIYVKFPMEKNNFLHIGNVLLSKMGKELVPIAGAEPIPEFLDYVIDEWSKQAIKVRRGKSTE